MSIEHYSTAGGKQPVQAFLESLPEAHRAACEAVIEFLATGEIDQRPRHRDYLGDGIWELRVSYSGMQYRILYTVEGGTAILLEAFTKKTQKAPMNHVRLAKKRRRELERRRDRHG